MWRQEEGAQRRVHINNPQGLPSRNSELMQGDRIWDRRTHPKWVITATWRGGDERRRGEEEQHYRKSGDEYANENGEVKRRHRRIGGEEKTRQEARNKGRIRKLDKRKKEIGKDG